MIRTRTIGSVALAAVCVAGFIGDAHALPIPEYQPPARPELTDKFLKTGPFVHVAPLGASVDPWPLTAHYSWEAGAGWAQRVGRFRRGYLTFGGAVVHMVYTPGPHEKTLRDDDQGRVQGDLRGHGITIRSDVRFGVSHGRWFVHLMPRGGIVVDNFYLKKDGVSFAHQSQQRWSLGGALGTMIALRPGLAFTFESGIDYIAPRLFPHEETLPWESKILFTQRVGLAWFF